MANIIISSSGAYTVAAGDTVTVLGTVSGMVWIDQDSSDPSPHADVDITFADDISSATTLIIGDDVVSNIDIAAGTDTTNLAMTIGSPDYTSEITITIGDGAHVGPFNIDRTFHTDMTITSGDDVVWGTPGTGGPASINSSLRGGTDNSTLTVNVGENNTMLSDFLNTPTLENIDLSGSTFDTDPVSGNAPAIELQGYAEGPITVIANDITAHVSHIFAGGDGDDTVYMRGLDHDVYGANAAGTVDTTYGNVFLGWGDDTLHLGGDLTTNDAAYNVDGGTGNDHLDFDFVNAAQKQEYIDAFRAAGGTYDDATDTFGSAAGKVWTINQTDGTGTITFRNWETTEATPMVCFTAGTQILTKDGEVAIEDIKAGDLVKTRDNGFQPVKWIGGRVLTNNGQPLDERFCPIHFSAGSLGHNLPRRDLSVSRQHRMLLKHEAALQVTGQQEALVAAVRLTSLPGVSLQRDTRVVEYLHILFENHELVYAEGSVSESLLLGEQALAMLGAEALREVKEIFPEVLESTFSARPAIPLHSGKVQKEVVLAYNS